MGKFIYSQQPKKELLHFIFGKHISCSKLFLNLFLIQLFKKNLLKITPHPPKYTPNKQKILAENSQFDHASFFGY
jgi:hypothetical protein